MNKQAGVKKVREEIMEYIDSGRLSSNYDLETFMFSDAKKYLILYGACEWDGISFYLDLRRKAFTITFSMYQDMSPLSRSHPSEFTRRISAADFHRSARLGEFSEGWECIETEEDLKLLFDPTLSSAIAKTHFM